MSDEIERARQRTPEQQVRTAALSRLAEIEQQALDYDKYIHSPEWRARAEAIKARDGYRCRICHSSRDLQVHHSTYERLGHEDDLDLITLCDSCHSLFHESRRLRR